CLCPTWDEVPYYSLLVETDDVPAETAPAMAAAVDSALARLNMEYETKRHSGRLRPIRVKTLPAGTWEAYDREMVARRNGRVEQYKHKFLEPEVDFEQRFEVLAEYA
ncbi:MAG: GH3 auxin-responsive promoter family protein, partial [Phycisphaerae bacterium]